MPDATYITEVISKQPFGWTYTDPNTVHSFSFEEVDLFYWHELISSNWKLAIYASIAYIITIFGLKWYMRNRPAYDLKGPLFFWNLSLGIFSIVGFIRTLPGFLYVLGSENGFYQSICQKTHLNIPTAYWTILFALSKIVELGDTVFIVLRKRPLIFLQFYHHVITMSVVWILGEHLWSSQFVGGTPCSTMESILWYVLRHLSSSTSQCSPPISDSEIQSVYVIEFKSKSEMYPYFALRACGKHVPSLIANLITTLQLTQMLIGFTVNILSMFIQKWGYDCIRYPISIKLFALVYGSFLLLFGNLFYESVVKRGRSKREKLD